MIKTEHNLVALLRSEPIKCVAPGPSVVFSVHVNLVALDVSVLCIHRWGVPRHVQLGGCRRLNGHVLRWRCGHCCHTNNHTLKDYPQCGITSLACCIDSQHLSVFKGDHVARSDSHMEMHNPLPLRVVG